MRKNNFPRRNTGILILTVGLIAVPTGAQQSLMRILSPSAGTVVRPGQTIAISVSADASVEKLVLIGQRPLGVGQISSGAAPGIMARGLGEAGRVQFGLRIPAQTQPGIYRVTAMGRVSGGDVESEAVTIDVEKSEERSELGWSRRSFNSNTLTIIFRCDCWAPLPTAPPKSSRSPAKRPSLPVIHASPQ